MPKVTRNHPAPRHRVLVVDDEPAVLQTVARILEEAGYETCCRSNVSEAQAALSSEDFHLVVSDLYLADDELGYQVADAAQARTPQVPVILLTGQPSFIAAQAAVRSRVHEIVVKPVDAIDLASTCRRTIRAAESQRRQRRLEIQNKVLASVLPRAIEAKDPTTSGHAERVVLYGEVLGARCCLSEGDQENLRMASLLHDVGKIGIPEEILTKEGPLSREERDIIETHPEMGRQILAQMEDSEDIQTWVYQHHERWDGRGYPNRLAGEEVALAGRILILAEVYDALAEARSYKAAWPTERIVDYFRAEAGKHFDPDLAHMVADGLEAEGTDFFNPTPRAPGMLF